MVLSNPRKLIFIWKEKNHSSIKNSFWCEKLCFFFYKSTRNPFGFIGDIRWLVVSAVVSSIPENCNTFQMCGYLFRSKLCLSEAFQVLLFLYQNFMKTNCFLSKWTCEYNFVPVTTLKNIDFWKSNIFNKTYFISYPSTVRTYDPNYNEEKQ